MKKIYLWSVSLMVMLVIISGCSPKARYERMLKHELSRGVREDSLFMGLYFGMPQKDFFTRCWNLNKMGLVKQGGTNTTVEFLMKKELKYPATMNFYPVFIDSKIAEMPVRYVYTGWAPWNKELTSDKLEADLLSLFKNVYGNDFMEIEHRTKGKAFVNINGNRRISIFKEDELHVWAVFTDMLLKDRLDAKSDSINKAAVAAKGLKKQN